MKKHLYRFLSCLLLTVAAVSTGEASITYSTPVEHKICPGDTLVMDTRQTVVYSDTTLYDTILVASATPPVLDTVVNTHRVNVYPTYLRWEPERTIERGGAPFDWYGISITGAGFYEKVYKSQEGCDSILRVRVRERVEVQVRDTLCIGDSKSWNGQVITAGGIYRDSIHFQDYDSVTILNMIGHLPDTTEKNIRIPEGSAYTWNGEEYRTSGVYEQSYVDRFGCDSLNRLVLTVYHVDTIDTVVIACPGEIYTWNGITQSQTGIYSMPGTRSNGDHVIYRIDLSFRPLQELPLQYRICDGESVTFNGVTYSEGGTYYNKISCDTVYKITIQKNPSTLHLQTGLLDATHPYYWQYSLDGVLHIDTIYDPGTYEYTTKNSETGCNDIWRLELTRDETSYHFIEEVTICENEPFQWHGLNNLNRQGIGQTLHYFDRLRTAADQDSIYELILTVKPIVRSTRTIPFCGSILWDGITYTESSILVDTLTSVQYACDSIVTTILSKGIAFHHHDTISIYPGETTIWRGQTITHDGQYEERHVTSFGCDSIYTLGVGLREAAPVTNIRSYNAAICQGDYYEWEKTGEKYFNTGDYTVNGTVDPDSVYILHLTVNPTFATSERVTFTHFPAVYRDQIIYEDIHEYEIKYTSSLGCDSIVTVYVDREVIRDEISATICPGETYTWRGHEYKEAYRYVETEKGADGKDSVEHILNLSVRYIPETRITKNICEGSSYTFADQVLTEKGVYRYTFREEGCDSVVVLSLNVLKADTNTFVHHMNKGDSYVWNGDTYWEAGTYYDRQINRFGCDSINVLELTINHVDTIDTTVVICPNEIPFRWHGIVASQTGQYTAGERQENGSYNFYRLHLTVRELVRIDTTFTICDDQNITFNGKTYSESGRFFDYLSCDTLMEVIITKHPQQVYATTASLGNSHGYTWTYWDNGVEKTETFNQPGTYEFESPNTTTGCSELWRLILTKNETEYHFVEDITICENEEFSWRGQSGLNHQGIGATSIYYDTYTTRSGKDSIYQLNLTVNPLKRSTETIPFCESYTLSGKNYTTTTTIVDTLKTLYGCDSIVTTVLLKGNAFHRHDTATIVPGETLYWRGQAIINSGLYKDAYTSVNGCDSIYTIGVGMEEAAPQMNIRTWNEMICEGDTYTWRGKDYFNTGTYVDTVYVGNTYEVDSLYVLNLTVNPVYRWSERITFTHFPANYRNHTFNGPETIDIRYASTQGCDSILTLSVDWEVIRDEVTEVICPGETFVWRGNTYSAASRYTEIETGSQGQDSIEHILNLIVRYIPDTYITQTICNGSSYTFGDRMLTESGNYTYTFHTTCDSTVHLSLNVLSVDTNKFVHRMNDGESYTWNGNVYHGTGTYFYYGTNRFGCDSVAVLELTVNKVDTIDSIATICPSTTLNWHGISASQSGDYYSSEQQADGSYNYYRLHLTVLELQQIDTTFTICDDEQVTFNGVTYTEAGHYDNYLTCDTLIRVHINKHPQRVYETRGTLGGEHGYTWTYWDNGVQKTENFNAVGTYEFESPNAETGCSEIWRLILSKDEEEYHFEEWATVCQGEPFVWHGHAGWSNQHVGETTDYTHTYQTRNGKDSTYTLHLTVNPVEHTYRTITFCGETTYKGQLYTSSTQVVDTFTAANGCDSIVTINLDKVNAYIFDESHDLPQGEIYMWHGQPIGTDGVYYDSYKTIYGCDSIYRLTVNIIPASPQVNQYTDNWSLCKGDTVEWRGKQIWLEGTHIDTVWTDGHTKVDSIFVLNISINPSYKDTIVRHMYTCSEGAAIYYQGKVYNEDTTVISNLKTIHGCDSIVKVYMHFNTATFLERSDTIVDTELPYTWTYQLPDPLRADTVLTTSGTYHHFTTSEGGCTNEERMTLVVRPTYLYELDTTVCETSLPFVWRGLSLQHTIGEMKQYEDHLTSVFGTDSIYRVNLTIVEAPRRTERIEICENKDTIINGKSYFDPVLYPVGVVFHDTAYKHSAGNECDSIIYYEITKTPQRHIVETRIMHEGETIDWRGETITELVTKTYTQETEIDPATGCEMIYQLRVIAERKDVVSICALDTPYVWGINGENYYSTGLYTDTVFDAEHFITDYRSLDLTVQIPVDTVKVLRGCQPEGVTWNGVTYLSDTIFRDTLQTCDTLYTVKIQVDTTYTIEIVDTICEQALPYILGRQNPDTIWSEVVRYPHTDKTACGCDSTVYLTLRIIPELTKNDSTFVCEDYLTSGGDVVLGNLTDPWFEHRENGRYSGTWQGKWTGIHYTNDTIVYNCDSSYFHHIIVRPHQALIPEKTYALCKGDSVQLFWPHDTTWIKAPGVYYDTVPTISAWMDTKHNTVIHNDRAYECDSITKWTVVYADTLHEHLYAHIHQGETYVFNDSVLSTTGVYDSIGDYVSAMDSAHHFCKAVYTLHLTVDPTYSYQDTIEICHIANREYTYTFNDDLEEHFAIKFQTPDQDSALLHFTDSTKHLSYGFYDHFYDLVVYYRQQYETHLFDTICNNGYRYWNEHHKDGSRTTRTLHNTGTYFDTVPATNMCDSVIILHLYVREPVQTKHFTATVTDREIPYLWSHTWKQADGTDTTHVDSLWVNGDYEYTMPNRFGCDSVVTMNFTVHYTHVFRDTIDVCAPIETTHTHFWNTGYEQTFTVPNADDTISYADTLITYYPLDSIYVLFVNYKAQTITYLDQNLCYGDSLQFGLSRAHQPRFLKQSGVYRDTLVRTENGCDSIIELRLNVLPRYINDSTRHISTADTPYIWTHVQNGTIIRRDTLHAPGDYSFTYYSKFGCDSIDSLHLFFHQNYLYRDTVQLCQSETPYTWGSKTDIYHTGEYIQNFRTADGEADSTCVRFVRVMPVKYDTITATICEGDSLRFGLTKSGQPRFLTLTGLYNDTLTTVHGCDSIITLSLNFYPKFLKHRQVDIADVDTPYVWEHKSKSGATFKSDTLYAAGEYRFVFESAFGCDSIDSLSLRVHATYQYHDTVSICYNETPYTWYNEDRTKIYKKDIYETGSYTAYLQTQDGYDSTLIRYVHVLPVYHDTVRHSMCEGSDYWFNGVRYSQGGTYVDTLRSTAGCDSIVSLFLTVNKPIYVRIPVDIYEGESYTFFGETYTTSGTYRHYGQTAEGCDSIAELFLNVHKAIDTTVIVCNGELPYIWTNKWTGEVKPLYNAGIYRNDTSYVNGERTFYTIQLIVNEAKYDTIRATICSTDSYQFNGIALTESGIYENTVKGSNGCDSTTTLFLTVNQPYYNYIERHIIEGQSTSVMGLTFDKDTLHTIKGYTPDGCDSITDIKVVVHPMVDTTVVVCANDLPYQWVNKWNGQITPLYAAGIYRNDTTYDAEGRQLFYGLQLIVHEPVVVINHAAICEGSSYLFNGLHLTEAGIYHDTLQKKDGCDSIVELHLTINKPYFSTRTEHIFEGDTIYFYGDTLYTSGTYTHYARTPEECDSTSVLQVVVHPLVDTTVTVCKTELPYLWVNKWNGKVTPLYASGIYRNDTSFVNGERMFYGLRLVVNEPTDTTIYREICEGDLYNFNNRFLGVSGEYRDTIKNGNGCDSVVILHLNVLQKYYHSIERSIYEGDTVMFQGVPYSTAGIYPVRFTSSFGCDSIVELRLTVNRLFDDSVSVCANELPLVWRGKTIYESGIYRDSVVNTEGKLSTIGLKVTVLPTSRLEEPIVATICEGDFYQFDNRMLTESGTYYDTLTAVNGCDSIVMLSLQVQPINHQTETRTIFAGDTVMFHGDTCMTSGIYTYTSQNSNGCVDTYQLILTVLKDFKIDTTAYVCSNELPFVWHGYEYSETGDYALPTAWTDSSRVVTTLHLFVRETEYVEENINLCFGNTFIINGDTIRESCSYYDTVPAENGCDRVTRYIISVQPIFEKWDTVYISDQDTYTFCPDATTGVPRVLDKTGDYECISKTDYGCDVIHHLHLEVHPSYHFTEYLDLCAPDTIEWHGQKIYAEGKAQVNPYLTRYGDNVEKHYFDRYLTTYGFDSIYELVVTNHPSFYTYEQHLIKELDQEGTYIHGIHITKLDTIYRDTLKTAYGCDSIFQIAVNTKRTITVERTKYICDDGNGYNFYGQIITKTGKYSAVVSGGAESSFDTIVNLTLIVNPISMTKTRIVITDEDVPYIHNGKYYDDTKIGMPQWDQTSQKWIPDVATTIIEDNYLNQYGCDSINLLEFVVTTHYSDWNQIPLCTGSQLIIDKDTIRTAGYYTFVRRSTVTNRMDSLYRIEVYEAPTYEMPAVTKTICEGDTVEFGGEKFYKNGEHRVKLKSVDGCDSIVTLNLTVYPVFRMDTTVRLLPEELPYTWENRKYYNSGDYERSWQIGKCDSTRVLHLIVITPDTTEYTLCDNEPEFRWSFNNKLYSQPGVYTDTIRDSNDKVYAIGVLHLSVASSITTISTEKIGYIPEKALTFDINFTVDQIGEMTYDLLFDNAAKQVGFKNSYNNPIRRKGMAQVNIPQPSDVSQCYPEQQCGVRPGNYTVTLLIHNRCNDIQSDPLEFQIRYPSWIIEQNWDDVVAPLSTYCNCGYEFDDIRWQIGEGAIVTYQHDYLYTKELAEDDKVTMWAKRKGINEELIPTHPITIQKPDLPFADYPTVSNPIQVYPNNAPRQMPIVNVDAPHGGQYAIYSFTGMLIGNGELEEGIMQLTLPEVNGIYFIRTMYGEQSQTDKILIY